MPNHSLTVSEETYNALHSQLGDPDEMTRFVEETLTEQLDKMKRHEAFFDTIEAIQNRNAHFDQDQLMADVDAAVAEVRASRP